MLNLNLSDPTTKFCVNGHREYLQNVWLQKNHSSTWRSVMRINHIFSKITSTSNDPKMTSNATRLKYTILVCVLLVTLSSIWQLALSTMPPFRDIWRLFGFHTCFGPIRWIWNFWEKNKQNKNSSLWETRNSKRPTGSFVGIIQKIIQEKFQEKFRLRFAEVQFCNFCSHRVPCKENHHKKCKTSFIFVFFTKMSGRRRSKN